MEMTEESYLEARAEMRSTFLSMVIGFVIGAGLAYLLSLDSSSQSNKVMLTVFMGLVFSGMPYVWRHFPYIALGWLSLLIKAVASICAGWIVTPLMLFTQFIRMKGYEARLVNQGGQVTQKNKAALFSAIICTVTIAICFLTAIILSKTKAVDGMVVLLLLEIEVIVSSILWVFYRGHSVIGIADMAVDSLVTWILRHIWFFVWFMIGEEVAVLMYVSFAWEAFILLDSIVYCIKILAGGYGTKDV